MQKTEILRRIEEIRNLPTLPTVIGKLNSALENPHVNAEHIGKIINDDPSIMAKILRAVNSSMYSLPNKVTSISQATALLGFKTIKNIAVTTSVFSTFDPSETGRFNREEFWKHSIIVGIAMNVLYEYTRTNLKQILSPDILHLAGLTHGIGIILFEQFFHVKFTFAMVMAQKDKKQLTDAEREMLGADHCEVGAWLAKKWNMPDDVIAAIRWHNEPEMVPENFAGITYLCHTAKYICTLNKLGDYGDNVPVFKGQVWKALGLTMDEIGDIMEKIRERSKDSEVLMAIAKGQV
jgi:HD-like signal output (HDOD) protein